MGALDMNCTELVTLMRFKALAKIDQKRVSLLIALLSGDVKSLGPEEDFPDSLAE